MQEKEEEEEERVRERALATRMLLRHEHDDSRATGDCASLRSVLGGSEERAKRVQRERRERRRREEELK